MLTSRLFCNSIVLALLWLAILHPPAHAYFDLATGQYMLQLLFGLGAAVWLSLRQSWFGKGKKNQPAEAEKQTECNTSGNEQE